MAGLEINSNVASMTAQRNYARAAGIVNGSLTRLATGSRINRGADDPEGLITSEALSQQIAALDAESRAADRSDAVASVADGALAEISGLLNDAGAAAVANANTGGMSQAEREANQMEIDSAIQSAARIANSTEFAGQKVLDGSMTLSAGGDSVAIASAAPMDLGQVTVSGSSYSLDDAASGGALDTSGGDPAGAAASLAAAAGQIATMRGQIGAFQANVIGPEQRSNAVAMENTEAARSAVRDTDYAAETARLIRGQILSNATVGALNTANSEPSRVLSLLA